MIEALINGIAVMVGAILGGIVVFHYSKWQMKKEFGPYLEKLKKLLP